ncbi:MAG: DUF1638 domain-containing protein [Thermodesulfobacteriota bacterium]|nr:DUF1638 domain-containing protein [Thermodesulfobacteriota bacterium]
MPFRSFADTAIVSCGTMRLELNHLQEEGFLDTDAVFFTTPGLHQDVPELEKQLVARIEKAKAKKDKIIVVYGGKFCYVNMDDPMRSIDTVINEQGGNIVRIDATHCMDMIADETERNRIARELVDDENVWWMTPGWVKFRELVFKGWDKGLANENFPKHTGGAIVLDGIGYMDNYMAENPEAFLDYCDWMGIPMQGADGTLDRFKGLLTDALEKLS